MPDQLVELIKEHERIGLGCLCGWKYLPGPETRYHFSEAADEYADHVALMIRQRRLALPVLATANCKRCGETPLLCDCEDQG